LKKGQKTKEPRTKNKEQMELATSREAGDKRTKTKAVRTNNQSTNQPINQSTNQPNN